MQPLASPARSTGNSPAFKASPASKATPSPSKNPSWNLKGSKEINLEINETNTVFQINKKLEMSEESVDGKAEVKEVMSETARRLASEAAKVEEFQRKTKARAKAAKMKQLDAEKQRDEKRLQTKAKVQEAADKVKRPSTVGPAVKHPSAVGPTVKHAALRPRQKAAPLQMRPKSAGNTLPTKARPKTGQFKGKGPVIASSTDSNPWDYESPRSRPETPRMSVEESLQAAAEAESEADKAAKKARALAAARVKVSAAKMKEEAAKRAAAEAVRKPAREVGSSRPLTAPRTVYSTAAKEKYQSKVNKRLDEDRRQREANAPPPMQVHPHMIPALEAVSGVQRAAVRELASFTMPPPVVLRVMEGVCVLVGEEPGWVTAKKLLSRRDFFPTLAMCSADRVPLARVKKFRKQYVDNGVYPTPDEAAKASIASRALCMWARAIESCADDYASAAASGGGTTSHYERAQSETVELPPSSQTLRSLAAAVADLRTTDSSTGGETATEHSIEDAFEALQAVSAKDTREIAAFKTPPPALLTVMLGVCVLVGEEPGWNMSSRLLKRPDFIPTLASCGPDRIPIGRINKFRSQLSSQHAQYTFPTVSHMAKISTAGRALCMWATAINSAFPKTESTTTEAASSSYPSAQGNNKKKKNLVKKNPMKEKPQRVPTPQKAHQMAEELARAVIPMEEGQQQLSTAKPEKWQELVKGFVGEG
jgi:hypothetical protein